MKIHEMLMVAAAGTMLSAAGASAQTSALKIYQIYGGGGNPGATYTSDCVVLFNSGASPASLNGCSLQVPTGAGATTWPVPASTTYRVNLPNATVLPGKFYMVQTFTLSGGAGVPLTPTPDFVANTLNLATTEGKIALMSSTAAGTGACAGTPVGSGGAVIDFVSFGNNNGGAGTCNSATQMSSDLSVTTWATRVNSEGAPFCPQDIDDHGVDFAIGTEPFKNSASAAVPCVIPAGTDLGIAIVPGSEQINIGTDLTYNATVTNYGPNPATAFTVSVTIPSSGVTVNPAGTTAGYAQVGNVLTWTFAGSLANFATQVYTVQLTTTAHAVFAASATVGAATPADPGPTNDAATAALVRVWDPASGKLFAAQANNEANAVSKMKRIDVVTGAFQDLTAFNRSFSGIAADDTRQVFWVTSNGPVFNNGTGNSNTGEELWFVPYYTGEPEKVATITYNGQKQWIYSLAFDGTTLYGIDTYDLDASPEGLYSIDLTTGATTLVADFGACGSGDIDQDVYMAGLDFSFSNSTFYVTQDSNPGIGGYGRGLYSTDLAGNFTFVSSYPSPFPGSEGGIDVAGLAAGEGKLYLVVDEPGEIAVFNIATASYEPSIAAPWTVGTPGGGAAYTALVANPPSGINLGVNFLIPNMTYDYNLPAPVSYDVIVTNYGPNATAASTLSLAVPAGLTYVSSNGGTNNITTVDFAVPPLAVGQTTLLYASFTTSTPGNYVCTATVSGGGTELALWNNSASAAVLVQPRADLSVTGFVACSPDTVAGTMQFTITNTGGTTYNYSPADATGVVLTVTLPPQFGFTGSVPAGTYSSPTLTIPVGTIPHHESATVTLHGVSVGSGSGPVTASVVANETDTAMANNAVNDLQFQVFDPAPSISRVEVLLTNDPFAGSKRLLPAGAGYPGGAILPDKDALRKPYFSPDGSRWIMWAQTADGAVLIGGGTQPFTVQTLAARIYTEITPGETVETISWAPLGINNSGQFAFACNTFGNLASDEVVLRGSLSAPGVFTVIAREGQSASSAFPLPNTATFASTGNNPNGFLPMYVHGIRENGTVAFQAMISTTSVIGGQTVTFDNDTCIFESDGTTLTLIAREAFTTPAGGTGPYWAFDVSEWSGQYCVRGATDYFLSATLSPITSTTNDVVVYNGVVDAAESGTLAGLTGTITAINANALGGNGDRLIHGTATSGSWVARNNSVIAKGGDEIFPGAGLFYSSFFGITGNAAGDVVFSGVFNTPAGDLDRRTNAGLVFNAERFIARENDAIDVNGNGVFDDSVFLGLFREHSATLTNDGSVYFINQTRGNCTGAIDADNQYDEISVVFARVLPATGTCCRGATCTTVYATAGACSASLNGALAGAMFIPGGSCNATGNTSTPCCHADYNKVNSISVQDIFDFLNDWFAGKPFARVGGDGAPGTLAVQDIFDFLNAWFAGC